MRQFITGFRNRQFKRAIVRCRQTLRRVTSLLAVVSIVWISPVFAKDPAAIEGKSAGKGVAVQSLPEPMMIPECVETLKLSDKQQDQVKEIVREYDRSLAMVWKQFSDRYMQTITMESSLLAAIEDNLRQRAEDRVEESE